MHIFVRAVAAIGICQWVPTNFTKHSGTFHTVKSKYAMEFSKMNVLRRTRKRPIHEIIYDILNINNLIASVSENTLFLVLSKKCPVEKMWCASVHVNVSLNLSRSCYYYYFSRMSVSCYYLSNVNNTFRESEYGWSDMWMTLLHRKFRLKIVHLIQLLIWSPEIRKGGGRERGREGWQRNDTTRHKINVR